MNSMTPMSDHDFELCKCGIELYPFEVDVPRQVSDYIELVPKTIWAAGDFDADWYVGRRPHALTRPSQHDVGPQDEQDHTVHRWLLGACVAQDALPICRVCGCTDYRPCEQADDLACYWLEPDLCSNCRNEVDPR